MAATKIKVRIYRDGKGEWRWRMRRNYSPHHVGASTEGYKRRDAVVKNFALVTGLSGYAFRDKTEAEFYRA